MKRALRHDASCGVLRGERPSVSPYVINQCRSQKAVRETPLNVSVMCLHNANLSAKPDLTDSDLHAMRSHQLQGTLAVDCKITSVQPSSG